MNVYKVCYDHGYANASSTTKYCPVDGMRLQSIANPLDEEIVELMRIGMGLYGSKGDTAAAYIDYPRKFNVLTGMRINLEGSTRQRLK